MAIIESRSTFPGFVAKASSETSTHRTVVGEIKDGGAVFVLYLLENLQFLYLEPLLAKVEDPQGKPLWNFKAEGFDGIGLLAKAGDDAVIALVGKGKEGKVQRVIPFRRFLFEKPIDMRSLAHMKREAAEFLGRDYDLTVSERALLRVDVARKKAADEAAEKAVAEARDNARIERIKKILARGQISGFTQDGRRRYGLPVLEGEWQSLSNGVHVVRIESIDPETGTFGPMVEAFQVVKECGKGPQKGFPANVSPAPLATVSAGGANAPQPLKTVIIEKPDGSAFEVQVFASMDTIRAARAAGLNGGTYVAADRADKDGKIEVYAVKADSIQTVGKFLPIA